MYKKRFDEWNIKKKETDYLDRNPFFSTKEIWWAQIGQNIASEIVGKGENFLRPVIIFKKVYGNSCIAIPLTLKKREGDYYFPFKDTKNVNQCALGANSLY